MEQKTLHISAELYESFQKIKKIFSEMAGKPIEKDEDVLAILLSGFIDSMTEGHAHGHDHHHHHGKDNEDCCGSGACGNC